MSYQYFKHFVGLLHVVDIKSNAMTEIKLCRYYFY